MTDKSLAHPRTNRDDVDERIRLDARQHPERTYRDHVEAAQEIAAAAYRREIQAMTEKVKDTRAEIRACRELVNGGHLDMLDSEAHDEL